jgi:hypothetical protein
MPDDFRITVATYRDIAAAAQRNIDALCAKYPGVCPGWGSGEIGWEALHRDEALAKAARLEAEAAA